MESTWRVVFYSYFLKSNLHGLPIFRVSVLIEFLIHFLFSFFVYMTPRRKTEKLKQIPNWIIKTANTSTSQYISWNILYFLPCLPLMETAKGFCRILCINMLAVSTLRSIIKFSTMLVRKNFISLCNLKYNKNSIIKIITRKNGLESFVL